MSSVSGRREAGMVICEGNGRSMPVGSSPLLIGSHKDADFVLDNVSVSRRHAEVVLDRQTGQVIVRDLKSRNGTYVRNQRIDEQRLGDGEEFRCGPVVLRVKRTQPEVAQVAAPRKDVSRAPGKSAYFVPTRLPPRIAVDVTRYKECIDGVLRKRLDRIGAEGAPDELRKRMEHLIMDLMREITPPANVSREGILQSLLEDMLGHGPLEPYLSDPSVSEIMVTNEKTIFIERKGRLEYAGDEFTSRTQLMNVIERIVNRVNRKINESSPLVDARLPDGSRVNVIIPPLALEGPCLTIRKFREGGFSIEDLVEYGTLTHEMAQFMQLCVKNRMNILISGGTGSGKTTLLNVMASFIPGNERIVTIEDSAELQLPQFHKVRLETRPENIEGKGRISIRDLVINALRMRPDRIVVGECRGAEALDMIQAMNTGHDGSLTTAHANTPRDALRRLEVMCLMAGVDLPLRAIREQLVSALQIVIQIARFSDGSRKVTQISEVSGLQQDVITMQDVFKYNDQGLDGNGQRLGEHLPTGIVPGIVDRFRERGISVDLNMFKLDKPTMEH